MNIFSQQISLRWADLDPNRHLRHGVYFDLGAQHRIQILAHHGLTLEAMNEMNLGPVIFREECAFKKEIHFYDVCTIATFVSKMRNDASRWTFQHIIKKASDQVCAIIICEGAWLNLAERKILQQIPLIVQNAMNSFPKSTDFVEERV
jgi:acyl-CoA thioester hydrolase